MPLWDFGQVTTPDRHRGLSLRAVVAVSFAIPVSFPTDERGINSPLEGESQKPSVFCEG